MLPSRPALAAVMSLLAAAAAFGQLQPDAAAPPKAARKPKIVGLHGDQLEDPYFWMREKGNPEVLAHLQAENAYADAVMRPFKKFEERLYQEMLGRLKQTDASAPAPRGDWFFYTRTEEGKQYPIICRKKGRDGREEVLLDVNQMAVGKKFMAVADWNVSDDDQLLAYLVDSDGHRDFDLKVKRLSDGQDVPTPIGKVAGFTWAGDHRTLFYTTENAAKRDYRVWRYTLGEKEPVLLAEEKDELFDLRVSRSSDDALVILMSASSRTTEISVVPAKAPQTPPRLIVPRRESIETTVDARGDTLYFRTNDGAKEFRVLTASLAKPEREHWQELIKGEEGTKITGLQTFADHLVLSERSGGLPQFRVVDVKTREAHRITFPEPSYEAEVGANLEYKTTKFRFRYQSPITSPSTIDYDLAKRTREVVKQVEVLGGYEPSKYVVERLEAPAKDGVSVPVTVVRRKDVALDGKAPLWLYGYGSYGISLDATFSASRLALLDRGVVYALAHIRGGGELGERWRADGRMLKKMNTFTDFIAAGDYLVEKKYGAREKMVIQGGSAGGLLIGAVLNLRPDFARAAILQVPFVDVLNTMADASLPLTTSEYIEWGNPNVKAEYEYMKTYSPYDNLAAKAYPHVMLFTSLNDSQVPYWEATKYAARLRATKTDANAVICRINLDAGHGGASGRFDRLKEVAAEYAFGFAAIGLAEVGDKPH
ncbi:MAG: S9 family peptidase [Verrucomicrobia bacterium]|nr:S9 family peptidase [Verrucomicrobiota bacterium]